MPAAWGWASVVLIGTLLLGYGLPMLASRIAEVTVPPGSIAFGSASIIPAADWTVAGQTSTSVTLDKQGVQVVFRSVSAQGASAAARLLDLEEEMRAEFSQLTVASDPQPFTTPTGAPGQLAALAGSSQTAVIASVVEADQAVDVQSLGESTQFGEAIVDIEAMITSIRIVQSSDG